MKLAPIVLKLRSANTRFGNNIAGCADLGATLDNVSLASDQAFVIQTADRATPNEMDISVSQLVSEVFSVIVVLANDSTNLDKTGITAYDSLFTVRDELWTCLIGWDMSTFDPCIESLVSYVGGNIHDINRAYLRYQFDFMVKTRLQSQDVDISGYDDFLKLYSQYILAPSDDLPVTGDLPLDAGDVDLTQNLDL